MNILKFSDGTTTVDFASSTSGYSVARWNPAVAKRRGDLLGGRGPYEDTLEEMEITINGADAMGKLRTLQLLMEQSQRWAKGEPVSAVLLHYKPESTSTEYKTTILGAGNGDMVRLPRNFLMTPSIDYIDPVTLRFRRLGLWLGESATATSSSAEHPTTLTINLTTSVPFESPVILKLAGAARSNKGVVPSYILMASGATTTEAGQRLVVVDAELLYGNSGYSTAADSTNKARGGQVLRYTPAVTTFQDSAVLAVTSSSDNNARRWGVFLNYRNNSTAAGYQVKMRMDNVYTPVLTVPEGTSNPTWAYLGSTARSIPLQTIELFVKASAASGSIDFDSIVLLAMDTETVSRAIMPVQNEFATTLVSPAQPAYIDHQLLSKPSAKVWVDVGIGAAQGWRGDATLMMRGAAVACAWLGGAETTSTYWRVTDTAGTVISSAFTATRLEGRLSPE